MYTKKQRKNLKLLKKALKEAGVTTYSRKKFKNFLAGVPYDSWGYLDDMFGDPEKWDAIVEMLKTLEFQRLLFSSTHTKEEIEDEHKRNAEDAEEKFIQYIRQDSEGTSE